MVNLILYAAVYANLFITNSVKHDTLKAEIFLDMEDHVYIHVEEPVHQIFTYRGDTLFLYYPDDKKAFFFSNYNPVEMPLSKAIIGSSKDFDLSKYGFRFLSRKTSGDTSISYWSKEDAGKIVVKRLNGKLLEIDIMKGDRVVGRTIYQDYVEGNGLHVPGRIHSIIYSLKGEEISEDVLFKNIRFLKVFPDSLKRIEIPKDVEVKGW